MADYHRQCLLLRERKAYKTSWIPEKFAVKGKVLRLKDDKGNWEDGWEVVLVYGRMDSKTVNSRSQEYKKHRYITDI